VERVAGDRLVRDDEDAPLVVGCDTVDAMRGGGSSRPRMDATYTTTSVRTMKTATPSQVLMIAAMTISAQ